MFLLLLAVVEKLPIAWGYCIIRQLELNYSNLRRQGGSVAVGLRIRSYRAKQFRNPTLGGWNVRIKKRKR